MQAVMKIDLSLASESSSKSLKKSYKSIVAAIFIAATFLLASGPAWAVSITAEGLKAWQEELAVQTLTAVAESIPQSGSPAYRAEILQTVARRLFAGYRISAVSRGSGSAVVKFDAAGDELFWRVDVAVPSLRDMPLEWFQEDMVGLADEISVLLQGVPLESLSWSDRALQEKINALAEERLPGWTPEMLVTRGDAEAVLSVSFVPQMPMILAVNPSFTSTSLPTLLYGEFRDDLQGHLAPLVGLPVKWASKHSADLARWTEGYINDQMLVRRSNSSAEASFQASQISNMNVRIESRNYTIAAWATIYAGTSDKSAELGLHLGRKVEIIRDLDMEAYAEGILGLRDWDIDGRFGLRWRPMVRNLWLGGEWDTEDEMWWGKLSLDAELHKPYAWIRLREDGVFNGALGWRATEYISFEVEYDERDEDRWSLKMIGNL